jgi:peptide deformylase
MICPCCSQKTYATCCQPFHQGALPSTPLQLMRSRFAAYALNLPDYIIHTTHPASRQYMHDKTVWTSQISEFSQKTKFQHLEILNSQENEPFGTVTFVASLVQDNQNATFTERSYFEKVKGKWLYRSGHTAQGHDTALIPTQPLQILPLAYYGRPVLRQVADSIPQITKEIRNLVARMVETMDACDGIGLAAPQIHHALKLFVIRVPMEDEEEKISLGDVKVFINPQLSEPSQETWTIPEGCLSIPSIHGDVERPKEITIEYTDLQGQSIKERVSGWQARVIMHENDHINGVLFIDHVEKGVRQEMEPLLQQLERQLL